MVKIKTFKQRCSHSVTFPSVVENNGEGEGHIVHTPQAAYMRDMHDVDATTIERKRVLMKMAVSRISSKSDPRL